MSNSYYRCDVGECRKKYKLWRHFDAHLKEKHNSPVNSKDDYIQFIDPGLVKRTTKRGKEEKDEEDTVELPTDEPLCCICYSNPCNTAVISCGHMSFCLGCITEYHQTYPNKGCPICSKDIIMVTRIYMNK